MSLHATTTPTGIDAVGRDRATNLGASRSRETPAERRARRAARAFLLERTREALRGPRQDANDAAWLDDCLDAVADAAADEIGGTRTFDLAFGLAPRRLGRGPLASEAAAREALDAAAETLLPGWRPGRWRVDEAVRVLLLTALEEAAIPAMLARLLRHADLGEQLALYRALALLPCDDAVVGCARQGLRSNVRAVFEAIAHDNPWPARHLDDDGWNQLVLKALFVGSALAPIRGLDERAAPELATMLIDYAHERRAAGRTIDVELWRALGPFATLRALAPFLPAGERAHARWPDDASSAAFALAAHASADEALRELAAACAPRAGEIGAGRLGWADVGTPDGTERAG